MNNLIKIFALIIMTNFCAHASMIMYRQSTSAYSSPDGNFVLRVEPIIDIKKDRDYIRLPNLIFNRWDKLRNTYLAQKIIINDYSTVLATDYALSNKSNILILGMWIIDKNPGKVIWLFNSSGKLIKTWTLNELYSKNSLSKLVISGEVTLWLRDASYSKENLFVIPERLGGRFLINEVDLSIQYESAETPKESPKDSPEALNTNLNELWFGVAALQMLLLLLGIRIGRYLSKKQLLITAKA